MIKIQNITKSFGNVKVLKGVNLEITENSIVSIVGASGAGKTTLLQIIGTLLSPDTGEVIIANTNLTKLNNNKLSKFRNKHIGFIFQFHHLLPEFTAVENVCLPAFIAGKNQKEAETEAKELLNFLGLQGRYTHKPSELSGGEQQRVAIARALINRPSVILADEPTGNLDSKNSEELFKLFKDINKQYNTTFVIVTHDNNLASKTDKIYTMSDGVVIK